MLPCSEEISFSTIVVYHDAINTKLSMPEPLQFMDVVELTRKLVNYAAIAGNGEVYY